MLASLPVQFGNHAHVMDILSTGVIIIGESRFELGALFARERVFAKCVEERHQVVMFRELVHRCPC